jgi:hypothetical protein
MGTITERAIGLRDLPNAASDPAYARPRLRGDYEQLADAPRPSRAGTGAIGWKDLFRRIEEPGYARWIGCEYNPAWPPLRVRPDILPMLSGIDGESFCLDKVVLRELV